ncbi:DUF4900 domain-containing protein [bacterium]|nr:DUF4900 domain-containing protein [bacterium]
MLPTHRVTGNQSGSTLVAMILLSVIILIVTLAVFQFASQDASLAASRMDRSKALYAAESGLARAHTWLEAQHDPPPGTAFIEPFGATPVTLDGGSYYVTITPDAGNPASSRKYFTINCVGKFPAYPDTINQRTRILEREVMTQSYAQFIYFTEYERPPGMYTPVWFCSADDIDGDLHTNGQIHVFGNPAFGGHVTSAHGGPDDSDMTHVPAFMYYNGNYYDHLESAGPSNAPYDEPTFSDGYELGASEIELPSYIDDLVTLAGDGGVTLTGDYEVIVGRDAGGGPMHGTLSYRPTSGGSWVDVDISSFNGVMYVDGLVEIEGVLDGNLTVASSGNICIMDDLTYVASDAEGPLAGCDDIMGLVSESSVVVKNTTANQSDCTIHAHVMALGTSFEVESFRDGSPRGTLTVHGGIVQRYRGCVGTGRLSGDTIILYSGYAKSYHYDGRFDSVQPPGYLLTGEYYKLTWQEVPCA